MIRSVSFKISFKIFQWMLALIIVFSTFLGYQFYQINVLVQKTENQRLWLVTKMNQYHSRTDNLYFFAKQYISTAEVGYLQQYNRLKLKSIKLVYENSSSDRLNTPVEYQPFVLDERAVINTIIVNDLRLRELEYTALDHKYQQLTNPHFISPKNSSDLSSKEYIRVSLGLMTSIEKVLQLVNNRYQLEISNLGSQRSALILTIPAILALNLILLLFSFVYMNRRMDTYHGELKSLTLKDYLTGAHNRKYLMEAGLYCWR